MESPWICFLLLLALGMRGVQTTLINILDQSYEKWVLKTYDTNSPTEMKITKSGIILYIRGKGYDIGTYNNLHAMWEMDDPYNPSYNENFTDRYSNLVECKYNQLAFFSNPREMYVVYTGNSAHAVRCERDYGTSFTFIISSATEDQRMGKLYILNTGQYEITNFWMTTQEITEVGDRVVAAKLGPSKEILIAAEADSSGRRFDLILLKPLFKDVTDLHGFTQEVKKAKENLNTLFRRDSDKRLDKLIYEISLLHKALKEKHLPHPPTEINTNITCEDSQLQELLSVTENELIDMFNKNILGNEAQEQKVREIQCTNNMKRLRDETSDFRKNVQSSFNTILPTFGSSVNITEDTCMKIVRNRNESFSCSVITKMNYIKIKFNDFAKIVKYSIESLAAGASVSTEQKTPSVVTILGKDHEMNEVRVYFKEAPTFIEYKSFLSSLLLFINNHGYDIGRDFSEMRPAYWFTPKREDPFTDKGGNKLYCNRPDAVLYVKDKLSSYTIFASRQLHYSIVQCHGDYEKSRVFIIASKIRHAQKGKLFVLDTKNYLVNSSINIQEMKDVGDNITAVTVRPLTGEVYITEKVTTLNENAFKLIILKPIITREETTDIPYPIGSEEFIPIMKEFEERLIDRYDKGWKNCSNDLIVQYNLDKAKINPIKGEISNDSALHDSFNDPLREAVKTSMERVNEIYHYNLAKLDDKISAERKERRVCQSVLNTFQTKLIRDIDNAFLKYETDRTHTDQWPEWPISEQICRTVAVDNAYSCARTDELRDEKRYFLENEKFLKKLRSLILALD